MCKYSGKCGCNITSTTKGEKGDASSAATLGYKVYTALLTQTGTNAPTAIILQNTLGILSYSYDGVGLYTIVSFGLFTLNKTGILKGSVTNNSDPSFEGSFTTLVSDTNTITLRTASSSLSLSNDCMLDTLIEIRVYP